MAQNRSASSRIEISASPEHVRSLFLDFPRHQQYAGWTLSTGSAKKDAKNLQPGDRIKVNMKGFVFNPRIIENSPRCFQWVGESWVVSGTHQFHFRPSDKTPGGTTFVNTEVWSGFLSRFFDGDGPQGKQMAANFDIFNQSFKAFVEKNAAKPDEQRTLHHIHEMPAAAATHFETRSGPAPAPAPAAHEMDAVETGTRQPLYELS